MTKHIILLIFAMYSLFSVKASDPGWSVNPAEYKGNMTITGVININGSESADTHDLVAAFLNGNCRGVGSPVYVAETDRWMVFLLVFGNESFDSLSFRLYDASDDEIYECERHMVFEINGIVGDPFSPYVWSYPTLSSDAFFIEFSLPGQARESIITDTMIRVIMPAGTDITALSATFTTNEGTYVSVNGVVQESGLTTNDFSVPVTYMLLSPDGITTQYYTVLVTFEQAPDIANFFSPNGDQINDTWIIQEPQLYSNCEFTIYDSMGNKVFHQTGYNNDWEGKYNDRELPDGTYYYIIQCDDNTISYKGSITLLR
jgi:gliding motility-associated-like protein